jgi:hypothetical protein
VDDEAPPPVRIPADIDRDDQNLGPLTARQTAILAQLPRDLREGISANARNKVFFNASPEDAAVLERRTQPALTAHDLAHLGPYQATARLLADGAETTAFTPTAQPLPPPVPGRAHALRAAAAAAYGATPSRITHLPL